MQRAGEREPHGRGPAPAGGAQPSMARTASARPRPRASQHALTAEPPYSLWLPVLPATTNLHTAILHPFGQTAPQRRFLVAGRPAGTSMACRIARLAGTGCFTERCHNVGRRCSCRRIQAQATTSQTKAPSANCYACSAGQQESFRTRASQTTRRSSTCSCMGIHFAGGCLVKMPGLVWHAESFFFMNVHEPHS